MADVFFAADQSFVEAEQAWREAARRVLEAHQNERPRFEDGSAPRARISLLVIAGFLIAAGTGLGFFTTHIVTILALVVAAGLIMFAIRGLAVARRRARTATLDKHKQELQNKEAGLRHALTARAILRTRHSARRRYRPQL